MLFVLLIGETIILSGSHKTISQTFNQVINQIRMSDKIENLVDNYDLKDYTYFSEKNPRRLRSLGGGIRRFLSIIKSKDKSLTNKKIIENLALSTVSGDKTKLFTQISGVENNTKFKYQEKIETIDLTHLSKDQYFAMTRKKLYQIFKESTPNEKKSL